MKITESSRQLITKYLGHSKAYEFFTKVDKLLKKYKDRWQLSQLSFLPTDTANLLFSCESDAYGPCVLKICIPGPEVATEISCLNAFDGRGYVKLWDYDFTDNVLLLERITPGEQMWAVSGYRERAKLMAHVIRGLPIILCEQGKYPTYRTWMEKLHSDLINKGSMEDALVYLNKALEIYDELKKKHNRNCLLHGDMHQENLLLNISGSYTVIDPKGVVDDPVMETARFLLNEIPCEKEKLYEMISIMSPITGVSQEAMLKSLYIDTVLSNCWTLTDFFPSQEAFMENKKKALTICDFVGLPL